MPRLKNRLPKLQRHHRGQAFVQLNGQTHWLGRYGSTEANEAYNQLMAQWLANGRELPERPTEDIETDATVTQVCLAYWRWARERYSGAQCSAIKHAIRMIREHYGSESADAFGPRKLRLVREAMLQHGWARTHVNKKITLVRSIFKWAASHELVSASIYEQLATVEPLKRGEARETEPVRPVPRSAVRSVRPHLSRPVRALIRLQLLTGARAGELVTLRPVDLDTSEKVWTYSPSGHKTAHHDKARTIYFGPRAQRILSMFMDTSRPVDKPIFKPRQANAEGKATDGPGRRANQKPTPRETGRTIGDHYTTASYRRAIHRACKAAGVEQWGPHRLRHNAATFLRRQFGVDTASVILGHSSLAITMTYAEANHRKAAEVIGKVG